MAKPFTIFVTQSAHTDIGYTHPQDQIRRMYLDYYERALELCRTTGKDPEQWRYKWVCETSWQVRHFVENRPDLEKEFLKYVRRGQIEITAAYLHFTDMIDPQAYDHSLDWVVDYTKRNNLPLKVAVHADINGWPWAAADIFARRGIPYFISHVHIDSATNPLGPEGSLHYHWLMTQDRIKQDTPIRIPQVFWWQGPGGGKVLHFLNEHYHLGNFLGLGSPSGFAGVKKSSHYYETDPLTAADMLAIAQKEVPAYVERLKREGYPYDALVINTSGYFTDNGCPDKRTSEVIRDWDEKGTGIRLRTATMGDWFDWLSKATAGSDLPVYRKAWPDHWAHGLGSETAAVAMARQTQRRRQTLGKAVAELPNPKAEAFFKDALDAEKLSLEHTFDAWCTSYRPASPLNVYEQVVKQATFYQADQLLDETFDNILRGRYERTGEPTLYVYADMPKAAVRVVQFDAVDFTMDAVQNQLADEAGKRYDFHLDDNSIPRYLTTLKLQPGINVFRLVERKKLPVSYGARVPGLGLESKAWQITAREDGSGLSSLVNRKTGQEWVDIGARFGFGQLVHEQVVHSSRHEAVGNTARLIALDVVHDRFKDVLGKEKTFRHTSPVIKETVSRVEGNVFDTLRSEGVLKFGGKVTSEWRLFHDLPLMEYSLEWDKQWSDLPEAAYVVFPFAEGKQSRLTLENGGGFFTPGSHEDGGQIPGTCSSYYTIQRAARIARVGGNDLFWLPLDAPLVMTNAVEYNRWDISPYQWNGLLASMPVNHYWHTNFAESQRGILRLRYRFVAADAKDEAEDVLRTALSVEVNGWR